MRPRTYVLEEDQHLDNLRKIIRRDFFDDQQSQAISLSLDNYLANFKSNENKIFSELVEADKEKFKKEHWWLQHKDKLLMIEAKQKQSKPFHNMLGKDSQINGVNHSIVQQKGKNQIFFYDDKEKKSKFSQEHYKAKKILLQNCKLDSQEARAFEKFKKKEYPNYQLRDIPETPLLQGKNVTKQKNDDYSIVRAASPEPQKIPLMTWGQIESTPMRISGPEYKIPQTPQRDIILEKLTTNLNKEKVEKLNRKNEMMMKLQSSLRPSQSSIRKNSVRRPVPEYNSKGKSEKDFTSLLKIPKK